MIKYDISKVTNQKVSFKTCIYQTMMTTSLGTTINVKNGIKIFSCDNKEKEGYKKDNKNHEPIKIHIIYVFIAWSTNWRTNFKLDVLWKWVSLKSQENHFSSIAGQTDKMNYTLSSLLQRGSFFHVIP